MEHDGDSGHDPTKEVIMTNTRLRIEDAIQTVGFGSVGNSLLAGAGSVARSLGAPVAYRMAPVALGRVETI